MVPVCIQTRGLTKRYGDFVAVDKLDLDVYGGEIFGFLGPNGAGKTTTIRMLCGMLLPTSGSARVVGYDVQREPRQVKRRIAYVPDQPTLYPKLNAWEFLDLIGDLWQMDRREAQQRSQALLELFELTDAANDRLEGYSHGMKQKIALAGALLHRPEVIFLDEPMVGLDPKSARLLKEVMRRLAKEGVAVFFSTHILEVAEQLCHRVGILKAGHLIACGTLEELRRTRGQAEESLEDLFLELTGSSEERDIIAALKGSSQP
ncbi:MAG: ABC transporter ATP-binding protein [Firmicutes bacterium]|nr:ABC transporter ATP-binding protein [Bacillota bacterium]